MELLVPISLVYGVPSLIVLRRWQGDRSHRDRLRRWAKMSLAELGLFVSGAGYALVYWLLTELAG